jgi:hypothetical protein
LDLELGQLVCEEKIQLQEYPVGRELPFREDMSAEVEESPC